MDLIMRNLCLRQVIYFSEILLSGLLAEDDKSDDLRRSGQEQPPQLLG